MASMSGFYGYVQLLLWMGNLTFSAFGFHTPDTKNKQKKKSLFALVISIIFQCEKCKLDEIAQITLYFFILLKMQY